MIRIERFDPADLPAVTEFVAAIQEHERAVAPDLKPGDEIGPGYAEMLLRAVADRNGLILLAREREGAVGFVCAWIDADDDPLLRDDARAHAYVSDLYVRDEWRRNGVGRMLLHAIEAAMRERGCRRIRICSKAGNLAALQCYAALGYEPYEVILSKTVEPGRREPSTG